MKKILLYIAIFLCMLYGVRSLIYFGLKQNKCGIYDKYNTIFYKENNFETLIIGSSRAESHFDTRIMDTILRTRSYNLGIEGASLPLVYDIFKIYLEKSKFPQRVILNIDYHIPKCDNDILFMFPRYFPYLDNESLYKILRKRDPRFVYFKYLPFYSLAFTGDRYLSASLRGFLNIPSAYDFSYNNGYAPVMPLNYISPAKWNYRKYIACNDRATINILDSISNLCTKNNASLYLVLSPMYKQGQDQIVNREVIFSELIEKSKVLGRDLIDYSDWEMISDTGMFADQFHMNRKGAELFTYHLTKNLKEIERLRGNK
ncbi:MAG: hypothetical protein IT234_00235 [Bacteroidia bacterium]|nr:hypothetical protein [Bacteroidia bacterium]